MDLARHLHDLLAEGKYDELAGFLSARFEVAVHPDDLRRACPPGHLPSSPRDRADLCWSSGTWLMWFKHRLHQAGYFQAADHPVWHEVLTCELHVGFPSIVETDEHLERLARPEPTEKFPPLPEVARSRLARTLQIIHPIDRVAARVAPEK